MRKCRIGRRRADGGGAYLYFILICSTTTFNLGGKKEALPMNFAPINLWTISHQHSQRRVCLLALVRGCLNESLVKWVSEDAQSKKGLMCQDTLGCIKLLSALACSSDTVCIPNTLKPAGVCVSAGVRSEFVCPRMAYSQLVCHLELNTHTALSKKTRECTLTFCKLPSERITPGATVCG